MTFEIAFVIIVVLVAFVLFVTEAFSLDVTALLVLSILFIGGFLTPEEAISGFSNPAVITIALLFVLSHALQKTRVLEYLIVRINKLISKSRILGLGVYLLTIGFASALINNTAIVAIMMPVTIRMAHKYHLSPSKLLIPLSYAAILGGTLTLVGTSTNLIVNSIYLQQGANEPLGMFEFSRYGIFLLVVGLTYVVLIAYRILPSRTVTSSLTKSYHMGGYLTELKIGDDSPLVGGTTLDRQISQNYDVTILGIQRNKKLLSINLRETPLEAGDILLVRGSVENFFRMKEVEQVYMLTDEKLNQEELTKEELKKRISELIKKESGEDIKPNTLNSLLIRATINDSNRRSFYINEKNMEKYNIFYFVDEHNKTESMLKKYSPEKPPIGYKKYYTKKDTNEKCEQIIKNNNS